MRGSSSFWMAAIVAGIGVGSSVMAAPIGQLTNEIYNTSGSGGNYTNASSIPVSSTDLIEGLSPSATNYSGCCEDSGSSLTTQLTDGTTGVGSSAVTAPTNSAFELSGSANAWYAVYSLGGSFNISNVVVTTGHQDARVNQHFDILLSNDGVNFTSLSDGSTQTVGNAGGEFIYTPSSGNGGAAQSTVSPIAGTNLGTAKYVELVVEANGEDVYRELDVNGSATPEPASLSLLGLGAMGLLARRRRA